MATKPAFIRSTISAGSVLAKRAGQPEIRERELQPIFLIGLFELRRKLFFHRFRHELM
jgi:hypothetical protein